MDIHTATEEGRQVSLVSLLPFLLITFGLAWGILAAFICLPQQTARLFGKLTGQHPLFYLAVYAPAVGAFAVVTCCCGLRGMRRYFSRLLLWRCSGAWYAFLIVGVPLIFYAGSALKGNLLADPFPFDSLQSLITGLLLFAIKGPVEELGWRGLALPLLQRRLAPIWSGLVLGIIWGIWHLPAFLLSGTPQSAWSFTPFFVGTIALSVIVTRLFNASRGSILLPALFHFILINPIWPDAAPYDTYLFSAVAVLVVRVNRRTMFSREGPVTEVIPEPEGRVLQVRGATEPAGMGCACP